MISVSALCLLQLKPAGVSDLVQRVLDIEGKQSHFSLKDRSGQGGRGGPVSLAFVARQRAVLGRRAVKQLGLVTATVCVLNTGISYVCRDREQWVRASIQCEDYSAAVELHDSYSSCVAD
jgi:hypothetical protein